MQQKCYLFFYYVALDFFPGIWYYLFMTLNAEIYEMNYACSPGGVDCWEINIQGYGESTCVSEFKTAGHALQYLLDNYPTDELELNVKSLNWYEKEYE